jgi:hypothetical protein
MNLKNNVSVLAPAFSTMLPSSGQLKRTHSTQGVRGREEREREREGLREKERGVREIY